MQVPRNFGRGSPPPPPVQATPILWRDAKWEHVSSENIGPRFLLSQLRARAGGEVCFLAGHFSCEPNEGRQQWQKVEAKLAPLPPLPLVILADHNSVMVPGSDTAVVSKEIPAVVRSRQVEGSILTSLAVEDVWVHLHGERRAESLEGFTFPSLQRRIDRVHLPTAVLNTVRSVYTVTTPSDHKAVVLQLGPQEEPGGAPRFRFPLEILESPDAAAALREVLEAHSHVPGPIESWWDGVRSLLREFAGRWRRENPSSGFTELQALVRESTPLRLAPGAWEFLQDLGYEETSVALAYQRLVRLQAQEKQEEFEERMLTRLRAQLQPQEARAQQASERRKRIHEMVRQLRDRQYLQRVRDSKGVVQETSKTIARALHDYWGGVMGGGGHAGGVPAVRLVAAIPERVRRAMPLLFRELSEELVKTALERLKRGSAPGMDGLPAEVYQAFPEVFVPKLYQAMVLFLRRGGGARGMGDLADEVLAEICWGRVPEGFAPAGVAKHVCQMDFNNNYAAGNGRTATDYSSRAEGVSAGTADGRPFGFCASRMG